MKIDNDHKPRYSSCMVIELPNFKILPTFHQESFSDWKLNFFLFLSFFFLEILRNYMSIIITIVSNIILSVSHNIIFLKFFMPMTHGVNKKTPLSAFSYLPPPTRFLPGLFVVLQEILYQLSFAMIRLFTKDHAFSKNLLPSWNYE